VYRNQIVSHNLENHFPDVLRNIVEIIDEKVGMHEADCPDKICYSPEYISRPGETIVCLPNRVVIEVKGEKPDADDEDIITGWKSDHHE